MRDRGQRKECSYNYKQELTFYSNEWILFCFCVAIRDRVSLCILACPGTFYTYLFICLCASVCEFVYMHVGA